MELSKSQIFCLLLQWWINEYQLISDNPVQKISQANNVWNWTYYSEFNKFRISTKYGYLLQKETLGESIYIVIQDVLFSVPFIYILMFCLNS